MQCIFNRYWLLRSRTEIPPFFFFLLFFKSCHHCFSFSLGHQSQSSSSPGSAQSSSSSSGSSGLPSSLSCTSYILKQTPQVLHMFTLRLSNNAVHLKSIFNVPCATFIRRVSWRFCIIILHSWLAFLGGCKLLFAIYDIFSFELFWFIIIIFIAIFYVN